MSEQGEKKIGPWRVGGVRQVFDNPWISVFDHAVTHPNGEPGEYGVVRFKNRAIGILPVTERGDVYLVGQHRFPLDSYSWELPEGGGPLGEAPLVAAQRELAEETGFAAGQWLEFAAFDISNSVTDEMAACYLAWDLRPGRAAPDASEALEIREVSFPQLLEEVLSGRIRDSLTIVMTLMAHAKALRGELPATISSRLLAETR